MTGAFSRGGEHVGSMRGGSPVSFFGCRTCVPCGSTPHAGLAVVACELAAGSAQQLAASGAVVPSEQVACCAAACALLAGLRPGVLAPQSTQALLGSLLPLALLGPGDAPPGLGAAFVALATVANRWQDEVALSTWLTSTLGAGQPAGSSSCSSSDAGSAPVPHVVHAALGGQTGALRAVAWLGRAMAMRNHHASQAALQLLLDASIVAPEPGASLAADLVGVLVANEPSLCGMQLSPAAAHAVRRALWQQRTFSMCLQVRFWPCLPRLCVCDWVSGHPPCPALTLTLYCCCCCCCLLHDSCPTLAGCAH